MTYEIDTFNGRFYSNKFRILRKHATQVCIIENTWVIGVTV